MINYAKANLSIDTNRIYVTGLSLGGGGVWTYAFESYANAAQVAAVSIASGTDYGNDPNACASAGAANLPIWAFHCEDDGTVQVNALQHIMLTLNIGCGGYTPAPRYTYYVSGGHGGAWNNMYDTGHITRAVDSSQVKAGASTNVNFTANPNMYEWFLMHTRAPSTGNTPPTVSAGSTQTITLPTTTATLSGTAAGTNGATISTYAWTQLSGPSTAGYSSPGSVGTNVTGLVAGSYVFTLTVTDNHGLTNSSNVTVTVNPANTPPTVSAGSTQTITLPTSSASLSGTAAGTNGATISTYAWTQLSGPSTAGMSSPALAATNVTSLVAGSYSFTLTVTDNHGLTNSSNVSVTVNPANTPPTVSAGSTQTITLPTNSASLSGTAAGTNGATISTYAWTQLSGPSTAGISSPALAATNVTSLVAGSYTFTLTVTDNHGLTNSSNVAVTVNPANTPPTVRAGSTQTMTLPTNSASLSGTAAGTNGATISSYAWTQANGPSTAGISSAGLAATNVTGLIAGSYTFTLTVTDNHGLTNSSNVTVTVNPANTPPVANAGSTQTITLPTNSASLSSTAAGTNGATISTYAWTQLSGPSTAGISSSALAATNVTGLVAGSYTFTLTVTDNNGLTNSSNVTVTVNPANTPPTVSAGSTQTITLPTNSASLSGSAAGTNGATISTYAWTQTGGPSTAGFSSPALAATNVTGLISGSYTFTLTVTDNNGLTNSANVTVNVNAANTAPTVSAGSNQIITLPTNSASLSGTAAGTGGATISTYAWTQASGPSTAGISSAGLAATNVTGLIAGSYTFTLTVTDNNGLTNSANVTVTVNPANTPPTVSAGSTQTITLPVNFASLSGTAAGTNGATISTYVWTQLSGPSTAGISSPGLAGTNVTGLIAGSYTFTLTVTDNNGLTNSANVTVNVNPANTPPTVSAGSNQTITLPVNFASLSGTAAGTNGATISTYAWTQTSGPSTAGISSAALAATNVTGLIAGSYTFTLTVTDNNGLTNSANVCVAVNPANTPPSVSAGSNQTITLPVNFASLSGTAAGTNGATISTYAWTQLSGPSTAGISSSGLAATNVTGLIAGAYTFTLTVTDNNGLTNSANVTVNVNPANTAPTVSAGSNQTITLPVNFASLSGTAAGTNGATISTYAWTQASGPSTAGISSAGLAATTVTGLIAGSYTFTLTVTDNNGLTNSANVTVTVNPANTAPTVSAGSNQTITLPTNSASLSGTAAGTNGATISTYAWTQLSGPSTAGISSAGLAATNVTGLIAGSYTFTLTVTDNNGLTNSANVTVTVNPANTAPTVSAGSNQTITLPTNSASLSGTAAGTNGATISTYAWTQFSGPSTAGISSPGLAGTNVTGLIEGSYVFTLTVTDNHGLANSANVTITVNPAPNVPPVAIAGSDIVINLPQNTVLLDGSDSYDPDGSIASYSWNKVSGPGSLTILNPTTAKPTIIGLNTGVFVFELTVTDNSGATATSRVQVTVLASTAHGPKAVTAGDTSIALPASIAILNGTRSWDSSGTLTNYSWTQVSGPAPSGILNTTAPASAVTNLVEGQYVFMLTITDNNGATDTATMKITVVDAFRYSQYFKIYPNPVQSTLNLQYIDDKTGRVKLTITDESGRMVLAQEFVKAQSLMTQQINVGNLGTGVYFLSIEQSDGTKLVRRFVKQ